MILASIFLAGVVTGALLSWLVPYVAAHLVVYWV